MHRKTRLKLTDLNPLLTCSLCKGYLIDATTLTECLHSFCRSCLVRYLKTSQHCPKCDTTVHKTRPLHNASSSRSARSPGNLGVDRALQNIVYKLVPGLFRDEMKKRREFYTEHPQAGPSASTAPRDLEARGEVGEEALVIYSDDEHMNLSLEYFLPPSRKRTVEKKDDGDEPEAKRPKGDSEEDDEIVHKRFLRCPAAVCVKHIKKFIRNKFDLKPSYQVEISHVDNEDDLLPDDYTLMDVAYIYTWRRNGPLPLVFRVFKEKPAQRQETGQSVESVTEVNQTKSPQPAATTVPEQVKTTNGGPSTIKDHSKPSSPPPPSLSKECSDAVGNQKGESHNESGRKTSVPVVNQTDNHSDGTNGTKHAVNGGGNHADKTAEDGHESDSKKGELKESKLDKTSSNNNEKTEVTKDNRRANETLSSLSLKSNISTLDLPATLATVGLVPAR